MDIKKLKENLTDFLKNTKFELYEVEYKKTKKENILRIFVDSLEDMTMDLVVEATNLINPFIDELDPVEGEYLLEVSSAGAEKELRSKAAVAKAVGHYVYLETYEQKLEGKLLSFDGEYLVIVTGKNQQVKIDYIDVNLIRLAIKF
jgi:ribosome maturation factor RimP